jgi:hypothetical protein
MGIVEEKLKYFVFDDDHFIISNFDFIFQRVKGLIENFHINSAKIERVFTRTVTERKGHLRMKRKSPET